MPIDPLPLPNGHPLSSSTSSVPAAPPPPPEIEATLSRLSAYRNVRGVMILSRRPQSASTAPGALMGVGSAAGTGGGGGIIQSTGSVFEGEGGRKYAKALEGVVNSVARAVEECDQGVRAAQSTAHCRCLCSKMRKYTHTLLAGRAQVHADTNEASRAHHHSWSVSTIICDRLSVLM
jgi:dynein light chain roadblock-type